jgi:hypothetical protein
MCVSCGRARWRECVRKWWLKCSKAPGAGPETRRINVRKGVHVCFMWTCQVATLREEVVAEVIKGAQVHLLIPQLC